MSVRTARAEWQGDLKDGSGTTAFGSGAFSGSYSFPSRFQSGEGTNPEEMIAAAHASCYSMAFANMLAEAGFPADSINTEARVHLSMEGGPHIAKIELHSQGKVPNISNDEFQRMAEDAKNGCPISKALASVENIVLVAELLS